MLHAEHAARDTRVAYRVHAAVQAAPALRVERSMQRRMRVRLSIAAVIRAVRDGAVGEGGARNPSHTYRMWNRFWNSPHT